MPRGVPLAADDVALIYSLRAAGLTQSAIGRRLGVSRQVVWHRLRGDGIHARPERQPVPVVAFFWDAGAA